MDGVVQNEMRCCGPRLKGGYTQAEGERKWCETNCKKDGTTHCWLAYLVVGSQWARWRDAGLGGRQRLRAWGMGVLTRMLLPYRSCD